MTIEVIKNNGELTVGLNGRLDSTTAGQLLDTFSSELDANVKSLTVDLSRVDYVSSMGLRVLLGAYKTMNGRGMTIAGANQSVIDILRMSGLLKIFKIV